MGRLALSFLNLFSAAARQDSGHLSGEDVSIFCSSLSYDLENLKNSLPEGPISLKWSTEAMNLLKKMQVDLTALFKKANLPISFGDEGDWFDEYMKATAAMLDFCNSLKPAISRINRHRMLVELFLQRLSLSADKIAFEYLETKSMRILDLDGRRKMETIRVGGAVSSRNGTEQEKSITVIMLAAKCAMVIVSMILVSAIVTPVSIAVSIEEFNCKYPQLKPVVASLAALVGGFRQRMPEPEQENSLFLVEHKVVDMLVEELKLVCEDKERFQSGVQLLRRKSSELKDGIEMFDAVVDELFGVVINGRNEMLDMVRNGALNIG